MALAAWVSARLGHVEIEEVACGRGIELIYEFLVSEEYAPEKSAAKGSKKVGGWVGGWVMFWEGQGSAGRAIGWGRLNNGPTLWPTSSHDVFAVVGFLIWSCNCPVYIILLKH
jgi:hypothetical protein